MGTRLLALFVGKGLQLGIGWEVGAWVCPQCVLCSQFPESHQHLFLECGFPNEVERCLVCRRPGGWNSELNWVHAFCEHKSFQAELCKLSFPASLYLIWLERNARVFGRGMKETTSVITNARTRVGSWKHFPCSITNRGLCRDWGLRLLGSVLPTVGVTVILGSSFLCFVSFYFLVWCLYSCSFMECGVFVIIRVQPWSVVCVWF